MNVTRFVTTPSDNNKVKERLILMTKLNRLLEAVNRITQPELCWVVWRRKETPLKVVF